MSQFAEKCLGASGWLDPARLVVSACFKCCTQKQVRASKSKNMTTIKKKGTKDNYNLAGRIPLK